MSEYEEGHVHFTVSEFARLCEELGFYHILPLFTKQLRVYKAVPIDLDEAYEVMKELDKLVVMCGYAYQVLLNEALAEAEERKHDDAFIDTDEDETDGKQIH